MPRKRLTPSTSMPRTEPADVFATGNRVIIDQPLLAQRGKQLEEPLPVPLSRRLAIRIALGEHEAMMRTPVDLHLGVSGAAAKRRLQDLDLLERRFLVVLRAREVEPAAHGAR